MSTHTSSSRFSARLRLAGAIVAAALWLCPHFAQGASTTDKVTDFHPPVVQGACQAVAVDALGARYITGAFSGQSTARDFNPRAGEDSKVGGMVFVTKYNADGSYAWTQILGGGWGAGSPWADGIAVSGATVYVTGVFYSTAGVGETRTIGSSGDADVFVMALNAADGSAVSGFGSGGIQKFGGALGDYGNGVAVSGSTLYVTGYFSSTDAGIGGTGAFATSGSYDAFVLALDAATGAGVAGFGANGMQKFGGTSSDYGQSIAVSGATVYVTGYFSSADAGIGGIGTLATSWGPDAFILALNATTGAGVAGFGTDGMQKFGGDDYDYGRGIAVSGSTVYVAGQFSSSNAGIGGTGAFASTSFWVADAFVLALDAATGGGVAGFGSGGMQKFGGSSTDYGFGVVPAGASVYVTGEFSSTDAGIGGVGTFATTGLADAFVFALDAATGAAVAGFGTGGMQKFGGSQYDFGYGIAVFGSIVYATGEFSSTDAMVGGPGAISYVDFGGFLLPLDAATGVSLPMVTSPRDAGTAPGQALSYTIVATGNPTSYGASGLPAGLTLTNDTISGSVATPGDYEVALSATNPVGTGYASLTIHILDAVARFYPPVVQGGCNAVALDAAGNKYVTGAFRGTGDFDPGAGGDTRSAVAMDAFVTKFNADGSYGWTQIFGGNTDDYATALCVSGSTVYVTGFFGGANAGIGGPGSIGTVGGQDAFVLALNAADGTPVTGFGAGGIQKFGGTGSELGRGIAVSGSTVYVTGEFSSSNAGIGGTGAFASSGSYDAFVIALDGTTGQPVAGFGSGGMQKFGGTGDEFGQGIAASGATIFVTGRFDSSDAGVGGLGYIFSTVGTDAFVLALDGATGAAVAGFGSGGVQKFGGSGMEIGQGIAVSGSTVYVVGEFNSLDAGIGRRGSTASRGGTDAFVMALNAADGTAVAGFGTGGVQQFGGTDGDKGCAIAVSGSTVYITGWFYSTDAGVWGIGSFSSSGGTDAFVVALNASDGVAVSTFGVGGKQKFGGYGEDVASGIAATASTLYITGGFSSSDAGVGGFGSFSSAGFGGFLLGLAAAQGTMPGVAPAITEFAPESSPLTGGTAVTITGTNFEAGAMVFFGTEPAANVSVSSATSISCTTPKSPYLTSWGYTVTVFVFNPTGRSGSKYGFAYSNEDLPTITSVSPFSGPPSGGTLVTIQGTKFTEDVTVSFGGADATNVIVESSTLLTCVTAAHDVGTVDVGLKAGSLGATRRKGFCYNEPNNHLPVIISAGPESAIMGAETILTAVGEDADGDEVTFEWEFPDGTTPTNDTVKRVFYLPDPVTVTVWPKTGELCGEPVTFTVTILEPNPSAVGVTNVGEQSAPVVNPLEGLEVSVADSSGGVVQLYVDVQSLMREAYEVRTQFQVPGRQEYVVKGDRPANKFDHRGLAVSLASAVRDGVTEGRARKMLAISALETADPEMPHLLTPESMAITVTGVKGKFIFKGVNDAKPDAVSCAGVIELPADLDLSADQELWVGIGNVLERVMVTSKGAAKDKSKGDNQRLKTVKVKWPKLKGTTKTTGGELAQIAFMMSLPNMDLEGFDTEGITSKVRANEALKKSVPRSIQVAFVLAGVAYEGVGEVDFKLATNKETGQLASRRQ